MEENHCVFQLSPFDVRKRFIVLTTPLDAMVTTLEILNLHVALMPPSKIRLNPIYCCLKNFKMAIFVIRT